MRIIEALTLVTAIAAVLSPFAAVLVPILLRGATANQQNEHSVSSVWILPDALATNSEFTEGTTNNDCIATAYMVIQNHENEGDWLVGAATDAAEVTELHRPDEAYIDRTHPQSDRIEILPNSTLTMEPHGYHVRLCHLTQSLEQGQNVPLQLTFASGKSINLSAVISNSPPEF